MRVCVCVCRLSLQKLLFSTELHFNALSSIINTVFYHFDGFSTSISHTNSSDKINRRKKQRKSRRRVEVWKAKTKTKKKKNNYRSLTKNELNIHGIYRYSNDKYRVYTYIFGYFESIFSVHLKFEFEMNRAIICQ